MEITRKTCVSDQCLCVWCSKTNKKQKQKKKEEGTVARHEKVITYPADDLVVDTIAPKIDIKNIYSTYI